MSTPAAVRNDLPDSPELAAARSVNLSKEYGGGDTRVVALDRVSVSFDRGQFTAIMGPSGSGKSGPGVARPRGGHARAPAALAAPA